MKTQIINKAEMDNIISLCRTSKSNVSIDADAYGTVTATVYDWNRKYIQHCNNPKRRQSALVCVLLGKRR